MLLMAVAQLPFGRYPRITTSWTACEQQLAYNGVASELRVRLEIREQQLRVLGTTGTLSGSGIAFQ